jgi:hypothetical protein
MRLSKLSCLFAFVFCLTALSGCTSDSGGPAKPAADMSEIDQFLADNPDQNSDDPDGDMAGVTEEEAAE